MADLYDRIFGGNPDNETQMAVHDLTASLVMYATGQYTSAQIKAFYGFDAAAQTDWDILVANIDGEVTTPGKLVWLWRLEAAGILAERGAITTKADYANKAGIT